MHSHQDAMHNMFAQTNDLLLSPVDRLALIITLGFEASRFAVFGALLNGGALCLYDIRTHGLGGLPEWIDQEQITVLLSTPSTFRHMFNLTSKNMHFPSVRTIVLGGESVTSHDVAIYRAHFPQHCILVNNLGSTETGTIARMKINHQSELQGHSVPAGYPIGYKKIVLVDESGQPVRPGEIGEILVKSRYLNPGYWRLPSLTAEKYTVDSMDETVRIFHTGDLGRLRPNGSLEHLGRKDSQIKIRGFRVDLAEIEAVLHQYPGIKNSAVIARELKHTPDNLQLVAYIEPDEDSTFKKKEVRSFLASQLPDYMVPPLIVLLEKLPLTPTGKVNRRALPEPEALGQGVEQGYIAPRDSIEVQLVKIWEKVLKTRPIGVQDDYFELGGNSLLAAQLFTQIEKTLGKKLPLATLFQAATIEDQANILRQDDWVPNWSSLVALRSGGSKPPLFCAAPVGGNVLSYHDLMTHLDPEIPIYGLQAIGLDGMQTVHRNVNEIAAHYIKEILSVQSEGPFYLSGSSFGGLVAYEMAQQIHELGKPVALVVMFDAYGPNYPKRLPSTSRLRRKVFKYIRRIDTHLSNLRFTDWQGRVTYVRVKLPKLYNRFARRVKNKVEQILHPVPRQLERVHSAHMNAARRKKRYMREERRFDGRLVLFRAEKQPLGIYPDPKLGWGSVVGDKIEVYEIPGHHTSIIYEPRVHILTEKLSQILSETQANQAKR
jgi:thioesterase domain-containing protein/acyl carrier protein